MLRMANTMNSILKLVKLVNPVYQQKGEEIQVSVMVRDIQGGAIKSS